MAAQYVEVPDATVVRNEVHARLEHRLPRPWAATTSDTASMISARVIPRLSTSGPDKNRSRIPASVDRALTTSSMPQGPTAGRDRPLAALLGASK